MSDTDRDKDERAAEPFEGRLARTLAAEREALTPEVRERLGAMRREAVRLAEAEERDPPWRRWFGVMPMAATAAAGLTFALAMGVWLSAVPEAGPEPLPALSEAEAALMQDLELLEDLEFLAWLEEDGLEEESAGAG